MIMLKVAPAQLFAHQTTAMLSCNVALGLHHPGTTAKFMGIRNGIDTELWSTTYSAATPATETLTASWSTPQPLDTSPWAS